MRYSLADLYRRRRPNFRRSEIVLRKIVMPSTFATDLYRSGYSDILQAWQAAVDPIIAEYERTLSELTQDSPEQTAAVISNVETNVSALLVSVRLRLERWGARIEAWQRKRWRGAVLTATGVDIGTLIGPEDARITLGAAVEQNVALIRSVSDQTRQRIANEVFDGFRNRKPAREVAKAIRERVAMSRRRALNISADQTQKLAAQLNVERATEAGLEHYEWIHSGKLHPREEHLARNGKRFEYGKPEGDQPGFAIHCGCTARAVLSLDPNDEF